ncbi:g204 [Coccomyxa viridis]|uniref:G204 protein n=1 Tax=Coccomyxa viridis TaxID=1274662 RepID=A0ABP1FLQ1_9CHLO
MVRFGEQLQTEEIPGWERDYMDYEMLKEQIDDLVKLKDDPKSKAAFEAKRNIFQGLLDEQISKVLLFYKRKLKELTGRLRQEGVQHGEVQVVDESLDDKLNALRSLAGDVTSLLSFVSLNMRGIRKILKKLAKHVPPSSPMPGYVALEIDHPHEPEKRILSGTFLPAAKAADLGSMGRHAELLDAARDIRQGIADLKSRNETPEGLTHRRSLERRQSISQAERHMFDFDRIMRRMQEAEADAARNANLVHAITYQEAIAGIFKPPPSEHRADFMGLFLNCVVAGLYMCQYMLIIPTLTDVLRRIGVSTGLVGAIAGASDFASMFMTPGYSVWTKYSFKMPVLAGAVTCLLSNVLYISSYQTRSLWLLVLSRFVLGFGSSRTVSRQYIADFVSKEQRMRASTGFVCASAIGMALGPFLALPLGQMPTIRAGPLLFDYITVAGWIMIVAWTAFIALWVATFKDPLAEDAARVSDLEQPLLDNGSKSDRVPGSAAQNGHARSEASEAAGSELEAAAPARAVPSVWRDPVLPATVAAVLCLWVLKLVQQGYVDGLPVFTGPIYGWKGSQNGVLLGVLGIASLPVSFLVGYISPHVSDRSLTLAAVIVTGLGAALCTQAGLRKLAAAYFGGGGMLYLGSLILEGASMCLLSKCIPAALRGGKSIFNAGLLTTEAGTLGRFSGNVVMSVVARITGVETKVELVQFAQTLYGLFAALLLAIGIYMLSVWRRLTT